MVCGFEIIMLPAGLEAIVVPEGGHRDLTCVR